jgi:PAS domain S-box-containing protein
MTTKKAGIGPPVNTEAILDSISDGVFTVNGDWLVTSFNRAAEEITGINRREAIGRRCSEVLRSNMCGDETCPLQQTLDDGKAIIGRSGYFIDADGNRIPISISTAVLRDAMGKVIGGAETFRDLSEVEALRRGLTATSEVGELRSRSPAMRPIVEILPALAASSSTVLIEGETGTGKEVVARTLHQLSPRRRQAMIAVNCAALPDSLLESELFGYKAGAFTGAQRDKPGRFALAEGGTLFLDEIGDISPALQVRLLRVLQERCYEPLGAVRSEKIEVRVIVATNRDLGEAVKTGRFREDLYYRINVARVRLPALRQRKEDIPLLLERFIARFNALQHKTVRGVAVDALSVLFSHQWPGNIRELENVIERAFILCSSGEIALHHLPGDILGPCPEDIAPSSLRSARGILDAQAIAGALARNGNNRTAAARELGMHKTTLFRRLKTLGLVLPEVDGRHRRTSLE